MSPIAVLPTLRAEGYRSHPLHGRERTWIEKNCYVDVWIELLHALDLDPVAMLPFVVALDFEGDQWTFFKPPHDELRELYGLNVQEMNVWRPLLDHAREMLGAGRFVSTEADAFWLPDTAGTDYRTRHTKTTIILQSLDVEARRLGYFHNAAYFELAGEDFRELFRTESAPDPTFLPLYAEYVRIDRLVRRPARELAERSAGLLRRHYALRATDDPIGRFAARLDADRGEFRERGIEHYHAWAFATTRQLGAAAELAAVHARWLGAALGPNWAASGDAFDEVSAVAKTFILKGARLATSPRPADFTDTFARLADAWARAMDATGVALAAA